MRFISALIAFVLAVLAWLGGGQSDGYPGPGATYTPGPKPPLLQPTQPDASFKPDQAQALANSYDVQRDDANGALVYLFPNGGGWVIPYTPTPGAAAPGGPTTTPSATARPILATATPTTSATPPAATGATWSNPGFEAGSTGWLTYALAPGARWNLEDAEAGARLVEAGRYSLRVIRDEWSAQPPILHGGAMGRLTGLTPGQSITLSCRVFGVQGSTDPFLNNTIRTIYSQARLGFNAVGFVSARMNFRGVGQSQGKHDAGIGETEDMARLLDVMRARFPNLPLVMGGFSFGTFVLSRLQQQLEAQATPAKRLVLVGAAAGKWAMPTIPANSIVIHGELDETIPLQAVFDWLRPQEIPVVVIPGADHFFHRRLGHIKNCILNQWNIENWGHALS